MTTRRRPSLRDNMADGDDTARQMEQAAELEQIRRGDAAPAAPTAATPSVEAQSDAPAEAKTPFAASPSPVAALAHAYMHGTGDAPPARSSGRTLGVTAAVLGLLAVGLAAGAAVLSLPGPRGTGLQNELQARIGALENALGAAFSGALTERVSALEKAVAGLEGRVAQVSGSAQVVGILAARQLRGVLADSAPFHSELALARLSGVADGDIAKALDHVAPRAGEGIPTRGELAVRFATVVPAVLNAELGEGSGGIGGVSETMWGWVTGVATVLRLPASETVVEESKSAALLTRAGIMLEAGDLSGAVERVSLLEGPSATAAAPWVSDARMRLAADQASMLLANRISNLLAAGKH